MVTGAVIRSALSAVGAVGRQMRSFDELAAGANAALLQAPPGLTVAGAASFLADKAQESDYFRVTEEYAKNGRYAPHIGRTFQMVTWDSNYLAFGRWCKARGVITGSERQFVDNPKWLADYRWAWLGGVWYFEANNLWPIANAGDHFRVSQIVNGGLGMVRDGRTPNHWPARKKMFDAFLRAGPALLPTGALAPVDPQEDDLTPEQDRMLREVYMQVAQGTGTSDPKTWGWPAWAGGTGEKLTLIDHLRRLNVEVRQLRNAVAKIVK